MDALVSEERDLIINPGGDGKPMKGMKNRGDVFVFTNSHQDPCSTVLNIL